ncbi:DUF397 domain-containing protein [Actinomadura sp. HBU206391]|uniref:DUF397 domain-containing protein n=1 Tax=Actinomadura sp. HBU206391 TaxID=2731692 RepID=UPI0016503A9D|nr:DUF397 domain-containing protein [Actinomadura sp. HBU206391]MBC6461506.1 DUF397 domain-containing protein [Actinomadura sp. HBU206391]
MDLTGAEWRKSRHSTDNGGDCVEVAALAGLIAVRDSKNPQAGHLSFSRAAFDGLVTRIKAGRLG